MAVPHLQVAIRSGNLALLHWTSAAVSGITDDAAFSYRILRAATATVAGRTPSTDPTDWQFTRIGSTSFLQFADHPLSTGTTYMWQILPEIGSITGPASNLVTAVISSLSSMVTASSGVETVLTAAPNAIQHSQSVSFGFRAEPDDPTATFDCTFDGSLPFACTSPLSFPSLKEGSHVFTVRAWIKGVSDSTAAKVIFRMDRAPDTLLVYGPSGKTPLTTALIAVTSDVPDLLTFGCRLDAGSVSSCSADNRFAALSNGNHNLTIWAKNQSGLTDPTPLVVPWEIVAPGSWRAATLSVGYDHACAVTGGGEGFCFGSGSFGRLGIGNSSEMTRPTAITAATDWRQISSGRYHTCGIQTDNSLWCWGYNMFGQLGVGDNTNRDLPVQIPGSWLQVAAGQWHTCAVKTDNTGWCWGYNQANRLGNGYNANTNVPSSLWAGGNIYKQVAAGGGHGCAIKTDDTIACWGLNGNGQLGDGTHTNQWQPTAIAGARTYKALSIGGAHSCAIDNNSDLWCWGDNTHGQLGNGTTSSTSLPVLVNEAGPWQQITAGANHSCAIKKDGSLWCWGDNSGWQLGRRGSEWATNPQQLGEETGWSAIAAGRFVTCGLRTAPVAGTLWCWGQGSLATSANPEYIP